MVVLTFDDAKPIVSEQVSLGKKIGFFLPAGRTFHDGYRTICKELKKNCDFLVIQLTEHSRDKYDNEYKWLSLWDNLPDEDPFLKHCIIPMETVYEYEKFADLIIRENRPLPLTDEIKKECKQIAEEVFIKFAKKYITFDHNNVQDILKAIFFSSLYYTNKYYFPMHTTIASYKEGLWRLIQRRIYSTYLNCEYKLIEPVRDEYGLCISSTRIDEELTKKEIRNVKSLRRILNGKPLVTSKFETRQSLSRKLYPIGWKLIEFTRYNGDLLNEDEDTYISIVISNRTESGRWENDNYSEGLYFDGFLFKK